MQTAGDDIQGKNHPLAFRMGVIAFLSQSLVLSCLYGAFGLLLPAVEKKFGVGRDLSTLALPLISLGTAIIAPLVGSLANKVSLKLMMIVGCVMSVMGFGLLAIATNIQLYLFAYAALIGPGMILNGMLLPSTLVTRWFKYNRGRALGFVHAPITMVFLPLGANYVLQGYGLTSVYLILAAIMAALLIPILMIVNYPPGEDVGANANADANAPADPGLSTMQLFSKPAFWGLVGGAAAILGGAVMLGGHMAPMVMGWGFDGAVAAILLTLMAVASVAGTIGFGWIADKIGGRLTLAVMCGASIAAWLLLQLHPPFLPLAIVIGVIGAISSAALPIFSLALSEAFGQATFARAFGLGNMTLLPFMVLPIPIAAWIFMRTGGYESALLGHVALFVLGGALVLLLGGKRAAPTATAAA